MLRDDLEGWDRRRDGGHGREVQEGGDICIDTADSHHCKQKLTPHCKVIKIHLNNNDDNINAAFYFFTLILSKTCFPETL